MRLGDLDDLKVHISELMLVYSGTELDNAILNLIDNAPTVTVEPEKVLVANVTFDKEQMEELVEKAKADILAQIERPQGEWIENSDKLGLSYICPFCGHEITGIPQDLNYCCKCGANMETKP